MLTTPAATLNRLSLSESHTNPVISGQLQKILQVTFGYLKTVPAISVLFKGGNSNAQNLNYETSVVPGASNLYQSPEYNGDYRSAKYLAQQTLLKNGNSPSLTKHEQYSGSGKEKGSTVNATLRDYSDGSALDFLRWRRLISPNIDAVMNCPVLSPFSFTNSIPSIISCGMRAVKDCDFAFFEPVAICCSHVFWCKTVYTVNILFKDLTCKTPCNYIVSYTLPSSWCENSNAPECRNTSEASNHNVNEAYTMALQHSTQTRPKFQYLFLAVCRSDLNATPHRESVTAHSEQDARRTLAGQFVLSFAGRIPAQGVCNA